LKKVIAIIVSVDLERNIFGVKEYIKNGNISKIYLLYNRLDDFWGKVSRENTEEMEKRFKNLITTEKIPMDPESFEDVFKIFNKIIRKEGDSFILVDVSSTTKMTTAVVASLASIHDIKPYIVIPENDKYSRKNHLEFLKMKKYRKGISLYEIPIIKNKDFLNDFEKEVLIVLNKNKGKLSSITELARHLNLKGEKKDLMKLGYAIDKLEEKELVDTKRYGRQKKVYLTFFGNLISDQIKI